jgi:hypothetical protein
MSQENVKAFQGGIEAYNDQDAEALLNVCDPEGGESGRGSSSTLSIVRAPAALGSCSINSSSGGALFSGPRSPRAHGYNSARADYARNAWVIEMHGKESDQGGHHGPDESRIATAGIFEVPGSLK